MKRDPVLAQLDALINGATTQTPPLKTTRTEDAPKAPPLPPPPPLLASLVPQDPVLSQLDALINPGADAATAPPPVHFATPVALVLPPLQPPPLPSPPEPIARGPPGILSEYGGIKSWMARLKRADAQETGEGVGMEVDAVAAPDYRPGMAV